MHNDVTNISPHISDVDDTTIDGSSPNFCYGFKKPIYGALQCSRYAKKYINDINERTLENADTYAWMILNNYLNAKLKWNDYGTVSLLFQKRSLLSARDEPAPIYPIDETNTMDDDLIDGDALPAIPNDVPTNCPSEPGCESLGALTLAGYEVLRATEELEPISPYYSSGGCKLSNDCRTADGTNVAAACTCTCDGKPWELTDPICSGFQGTPPVTVVQTVTVIPIAATPAP
ncbi:uncharacterized protein BDZ99DRAFT_458455 [Mytilinidion resinicola]|uniref:Uncharacterized protein n=1 Tax=Mytilinidion resinicola TaxID=574789 RepID=A0A6A6Z6E1_9PEZI|nr:uncharacterized protein BDZ99DRAFT_458455 [Mytilinidion resinicola]KAF2816600.1 hypothetical protein BDZ99DRAFT_458455 [Mytilinidion resinicola]